MKSVKLINSITFEEFMAQLVLILKHELKSVQVVL